MSLNISAHSGYDHISDKQLLGMAVMKKTPTKNIGTQISSYQCNYGGYSVSINSNGNNNSSFQSVSECTAPGSLYAINIQNIR